MKKLWFNLLKLIHNYAKLCEGAAAGTNMQLQDERYPITLAGFRAARRAWLNEDPSTYCDWPNNDGRVVVECNIMRAPRPHWSEVA